MRTLIVLLLVIAVVELSSCSSPSSQPVAQAEAATGPQTPNADTAAAATALTVDSPPEVVCEHFINLLRSGQTEQAERSMTQKALAEIRSCELELSTPGGPDAVYRFQPAEFATAKQEIAFVPCIVVEQGQTQEFSIMLKKGEVGWKVAGMLLQDTDRGSDLVSFENPNDVVRIKSMLGLDPGSTPHQAAADSTLR